MSLLYLVYIFYMFDWHKCLWPVPWGQEEKGDIGWDKEVIQDESGLCLERMVESKVTVNTVIYDYCWIQNNSCEYKSIGIPSMMHEYKRLDSSQNYVWRINLAQKTNKYVHRKTKQTKDRRLT